MIKRCTNSKSKSFTDYGGRGITVCSEWLNSFEAFFADMGEKPTAAHEIDRRDNALGYFKDNCQWVTRKINSINKRTSKFWWINGVKYNGLRQATEMTGIPGNLIHKRTKRGATGYFSEMKYP